MSCKLTPNEAATARPAIEITAAVLREHWPAVVCQGGSAVVYIAPPSTPIGTIALQPIRSPLVWRWSINGGAVHLHGGARRELWGRSGADGMVEPDTREQPMEITCAPVELEAIGRWIVALLFARARGAPPPSPPAEMTGPSRFRRTVAARSIRP